MAQRLIPGIGYLDFTHNAEAMLPGIGYVGDVESTALATASSLVGPNSGMAGYQTSNFTVTVNGPLDQDYVFTPSDDAGGTFSPASVTLNNTITLATFKYTPAAEGNRTITLANNSGGMIAQPSPFAFTAAHHVDPPLITSTSVAIDGQDVTVTVALANEPTSGQVSLLDTGGNVDYGPATMTINAGKTQGTAVFNQVEPGTYTAAASVLNSMGQANASSAAFDIDSLSGTLDGELPVVDGAPVMSGSISVSAITSSGFTLAWSAATDDVAVTGYEYSIDGGVTYTSTGTDLGVTVTGRQPATTYPVRARARDSGGNVSNPLIASVTTLAGAQADTSPPVLSGAISASGITTAGFTLSWQAGTDNVGITLYEVSIDGGATWSSNGLGTSIPFAGLAASTTYATRVRAKDAAGNVSNVLAKDVTTIAPESITVPGAPTNVVATAGVGSVSVAFVEPADNGGSPITGYQVKASTGQSVNVPGSPGILLMPAGIAVSFTVKATNAIGTGPASSPSNIVTPTGTTTDGSGGGTSTPTVRDLTPAPKSRIIRL